MRAYANSQLNPKPPVGADGLFSGVTEQRFDPANYQYEDKFGHAYKLHELSREDLMQIACYGMEAMEQMDILIDKQNFLMNSWRKDNELPKEPVE
jgi:hypothetical protein